MCVEGCECTCVVHVLRVPMLAAELGSTLHCQHSITKEAARLSSCCQSRPANRALLLPLLLRCRNLPSYGIDSTIPANGWQLPSTLLNFALPKNSLRGSLRFGFAVTLPLGLSLLDFSSNRLEGSLPAGFAPPALQTLLLSNNTLSGSFDPDVLPGGLVDVDLSGNFFNGSLPKKWTGPEGILSMQLQNNRLSGAVSIGKGLSRCTGLEK